MKKFVMAQRDDIIRATYGRGQYRVTQEYARLLVSHQEWIKMTPEQRKDVKRDTFASLYFLLAPLRTLPLVLKR